MNMYDAKENDFTISPELDADASWAMEQCWHTIAPDCLAMEEDGTMDRDGVLEVVLDADRLADYGMDAARYTIWVKNFHPKHWETLVNKTFPYKTFGY